MVFYTGFKCFNQISHVDIVVKLVVASESQQNPKSGAQGEENLGGCIEPDLKLIFIAKPPF